MRGRWEPGEGAIIGLTLAASFAFAALGVSLAHGATGIAPLWLTNAVVLAALLRLPKVSPAGVLSAAFAGIAGASIAFGTDVRMAAALALVNVLEIVVGLYASRWFGDAAEPMYSPRNITAFMLGAGLIAPSLSAPVAAAVLSGIGSRDYTTVAIHWFAADALGLIAVGPLLLAAGCGDARRLFSTRRVIDFIVNAAAIAGITVLVFEQSRYPALFLILPVMTIAVFRLRFLGAALGIVLVALIASIETLDGAGPIAGSLSDIGERILYLQVFLAVAVVSTLPLAAILVERERDLKRLARSEQQYRLLAEHSNDMIVRIGLDGLRRYISPACVDILGYRPEELTGETPIAEIHVEDRARVERVCRSLLDGAVDPVCMYRQRRRDGDFAWLEATYRLVRDPSGVPSEFIASVRDIGRRRSAELEGAAARAKLEESHRLLRMAEGLAGVGHWRLDAQTQDIFWSDEVFRIHGRVIGDYPPLAEAIDAYHPDDRAMVGECVTRALEDGNPYTFVARVFRPDGAMRHVESSGQVERAPDNLILGLFGVFRDITDRVEAEAELIDARDEARASVEAKSAFLATMSHEIRTPMTGVLGMIELLRADLPEAERERFFDNLEQSASLLMTVLDDVLDFSKIESSNLILESVDFDLAELTRNTLDLFHHAASIKGLLLTLDCPLNQDTGVRGDPVRLQQVLSNLISNAIKFTAVGRIDVHVRIVRDADRCRAYFEVRDTGVGVASEATGKLFEPFVQADASTTRRFGGTGLGLAISKRLVEAMDGNIALESTLGIGTIFRFDVLLDRRSVIPSRAAPARVTARRALSVLLAEDNAVNRALVEALVRRAGHSIRSVENGALAVEAAAAEAFDTILMDMQMPEMDGVAATRAIRGGGGPCAGVPIIALTADASAERRRFYDNVGLSDFLTKPIDSKALIERLAFIANSIRNVPSPSPQPPGVIPGDDALLDSVTLDTLAAVIGAGSRDRLLSLYLDELKTRPAIIADAIARDQRSAVAEAAHALKGASLNIGAARIAALASELEAAATTDADMAALGNAISETADATRSLIDRRAEREQRA